MAKKPEPKYGYAYMLLTTHVKDKKGAWVENDEKMGVHIDDMVSTFVATKSLKEMNSFFDALKIENPELLKDRKIKIIKVALEQI